jgi:hypothetical protein
MINHGCVGNQSIRSTGVNSEGEGVPSSLLDGVPETRALKSEGYEGA